MKGQLIIIICLTAGVTGGWIWVRNDGSWVNVPYPVRGKRFLDFLFRRREKEVTTGGYSISDKMSTIITPDLNIWDRGKEGMEVKVNDVGEGETIGNTLFGKVVKKGALGSSPSFEEISKEEMALLGDLESREEKLKKKLEGIDSELKKLAGEVEAAEKAAGGGSLPSGGLASSKIHSALIEAERYLVGELNNLAGSSLEKPFSHLQEGSFPQPLSEAMKNHFFHQLYSK